MATLQQQHRVVALIGYSMGGALALHTALEHPPAGLVLLAPFWSFGEGWLRILWPVVNLVFRRVKPLQHADFSAKDVRRALHRMYNGIDLDDAQIRQALRRTTVSLDPIAQVRLLGQRAFKQAPKIVVPTLVIQGSRDRVVRSGCTSRLLERLPRSIVQYHEVSAGHDLIDPECEAWEEVKDCVLSFAERIREPAASATPVHGLL
jgi:pimeloyl-ACP methyl ester carboxylesterase